MLSYIDVYFVKWDISLNFHCIQFFLSNSEKRPENENNEDLMEITDVSTL